MNAYLILAEKVLLAVKEPLSAREILLRARLNDLVPRHLRGATQFKTLHARLSEDIARAPDDSLFFRTAPGKFYLKSLLRDPKTPAAYRRVHHAPPRRKELKRDLLLAVDSREIQYAADYDGRICVEDLEEILKAGEQCYMHWRDLRTSPQYISIHSFVIVHKKRSFLTYRKGRYRPDFDPIFTPRSIGFGGSVFSSDVDILFDSLFGIIENGIKELIYSVGLHGYLAEQTRYSNRMIPRFAMTSAGSDNRTHLDVVLTFCCPDDFEPTKTALSSNDLRWLSADNIPNDVSHYDISSKTILEQGWLEALIG